MLDLCQRKGFTKLYLHAQARLAPFYQMYGFEIVGREFGFSDHDYVEMVLRTSVRHDAMALNLDPLVLNRPEGRLDVPGPIEHSVARMANGKVRVAT
jgi:hypothetical protein